MRFLSILLLAYVSSACFFPLFAGIGASRPYRFSQDEKFKHIETLYSRKAALEEEFEKEKMENFLSLHGIPLYATKRVTVPGGSVLLGFAPRDLRKGHFRIYARIKGEYKEFADNGKFIPFMPGKEA